jgi:peptidoglycan/LPS O-acetylase OafA/YrhL
MLKNNLSSTETRNDGIDMLRGFSILLVILLHCFIHMPFAHSIFPERLINIIFRSGYYGVIIFFVISGFLITTTSLRKWGGLNNMRGSQFYKMRFARIIPCLLVLLLALSALDIFGVNGFVIHTTSLGQAIFSALTFHINWLEAKTGYLPGNWDVLWSLSVEEIFYLFFPLVCLTLKKRSHFMVAMLIFIILGPFARTVFTGNVIWSDHSYLSCMDGIAVGCLAALFANGVNLNRKIFLRTLFAGLSLFIFVFIFRKQAYDLGLTKTGLNVTILEFGVGMILISMHEWCGKNGNLGAWPMAPFRWLGRNSYEIYLTHSFIIILLASFLFNAKQSTSIIIILYAITIILSGILGQLISTYFSEPLNRFIRSKTGSPTKTHTIAVLSPWR